MIVNTSDSTIVGSASPNSLAKSSVALISSLSPSANFFRQKMILFAAHRLFSSPGINQIVYVKSDNDVSEKLINMMEKFTKRMIDLENRLDAMNK